MGRRGAIYVRQSKTRERSESRADQLKHGRETARRFDVEIVAEVMEPPSTSGFKDRGRRRKAWRELLELIENDVVDCVIVYTTARLTRGGIQSYAELLDAAEARDLDPNRLVLTPGGWRSRMEMSIFAEIDHEDSLQKSRYSKDLHAKLAAEGRYSGSGPRPFGYEQDGTTPHPVEAPLVAEACRRAADGESWYSIAQDFHDRGIVGTRGAPMKPENLAKIVRSPRVAGKRVHRPDKNKPPRIVDDAWPAIVDLDDWKRIQRRAPGRPVDRANVFAGLIYCDLCKHKLVARWSGPGGVRRYTCPIKIEGGCGGVSIREHLLEGEIVGRLAAVVDVPTAAQSRRRKKTGTDPAKRIAELEDRLAELAEDYAVGTIGRGEWTAAKQAIDRQVSSLHREMTRARRPLDLQEWAGRGGELPEAWKAMDFPKRRALLEAAIERIDLAKPSPEVTSGQLDPDRIHVTWRE